MANASRIGRYTVTKGQLGALLYIILLEYGFYAVVRLFPNLGTPTIDLLFIVWQRWPSRES